MGWGLGCGALFWAAEGLGWALGFGWVLKRPAEAMPKRCRRDAEAMPKRCRRDAEAMPKRCRRDAEAMPKGQIGPNGLPKRCRSAKGQTGKAGGGRAQTHKTVTYQVTPHSPQPPDQLRAHNSTKQINSPPPAFPVWPFALRHRFGSPFRPIWPFGIASASLRHRFGIASASLRHRFGIASASLRHRFGIASAGRFKDPPKAQSPAQPFSSPE